MIHISVSVKNSLYADRSKACHWINRGNVTRIQGSPCNVSQKKRRNPWDPKEGVQGSMTVGSMDPHAFILLVCCLHRIS